MPPKGSKRAKAAEPEPEQRIKFLQSEITDLRALLARAANKDTALQLYHDLMDSFNSVGCHFHCPSTGKWKWRGHLSYDNCLAVKMCLGTLKLSGQCLEHDGEKPGQSLSRLAHENACKPAAKLMRQCID